jgi:hypothetical protein
MKREVAIERLQQAFRYEPETGSLFWIGVNKRMVGKKAGCPTDRYRKVCVDGVRIPEHRAIWALAYGTWPEKEIDHINRDGHDNRLVNLRLATRSENCANRGLLKNNAVGSPCVRKNRSGKFDVRVQRDGNRVYVGSFADLESAEKAVFDFKVKYNADVAITLSHSIG